MANAKGKKIVLIYPKLEKYTPGRIHYYPLPVLAIAGSLLKEGYDVTIFDSRVEERFDHFLDSLKEPPLFFGLSVIIGYPIIDALQLSRQIKARFPNIPVVWGGWFPALEPIVTLQEDTIDLVVRGPGEKTVVRLAHCLEQGGDLGQVGALAYRRNGEIIVDEPASPFEIHNEGFLPYHILDPSKYNCVKRKEINYITSHGCPYDCRFCCVTYIYHRKWRPVPAKRVIDDISHLVNQYGIKHIEFQDDNFFTNRQRAKDILKEIISRSLNITWTGQARFDNIVRFDEELFDLIKRSGCRCLYASGESGSEEVLKVIRKRITVQHTLSGVNLLEKHDIPLRTTFMVGLPQESLSDLRMTLDLSKRIMDIKKQLQIYYSFYRPVPSTELFNEAAKENIITKPKTLDEWATYVTVDQKQFWLFLREKTTKARNDAKKLSFYFWFSNYRPFLKKHRRTKLGFILKLIRPVFQFRYRHNLLFFPLEWYLFNLLFKLRPDIFYKKLNAD